MTNYRNWTPQQKAQYILGALSDKQLSGELFGFIQGWLLSDDNAEAKHDELDMLLDRLFEEHGKPGRRTYELLAQLHERYGLPAPEIPTGKRVSMKRRILVRVAAVLVPVMIAAGAGVVLLNRSDAVGYVTEQSAADSFRKLTLPDGSTVRMAPGTELQYAEDFTMKRSVKLSGEAFFAVEKVADNPFTVETEELTVTVLGTEFNIKARPGDAETLVSLASGRLEVKAAGISQVLSPMEQFVYDNETGKCSVEQLAGLAADRWKGIDRVLENIPVREALEIAGEFYNVRMVIDDALRHDPIIRTTLRSESSLEDALYAIQAVAKNFDYSTDGGTVTITAR